MKNLVLNHRKISAKIFAIALASLLFACNDDSDEPNPNANTEQVIFTTTEVNEIEANSEVAADEAFEDIDAIVDEAEDYSAAARILNEDNQAGSCVVIQKNIDSLSNTVTVDLDFGDGCTNKHGRLRRGKINIVYVLRRFQPGATRTVTFDNFYVDSIKVEGTRTWTNKSDSATAPVRKWEITLANGQLTFPDGSLATRTASKLRTSQIGKVETTGSASGISRLGYSYAIEIKEPITFTRACASQGFFYPTSGTKVKTITSLEDDTVSEFSVDYGDGTCDNLMTITKDGESKEIEMKPRKRFEKIKKLRK